MVQRSLKEHLLLLNLMVDQLLEQEVASQLERGQQSLLELEQVVQWQAFPYVQICVSNQVLEIS